MSIRRISLLGHPEVSFEGRPLRFRIKKALALLCYLAAEGKKYPRGELAELLWPRSDRRSARTDLRGALAKLRKTLGEDGAHADAHDEEEVQEDGYFPLLVAGDLLGVEPRGINLDLRTLESAVELARSEASGTSPGGSRVDGAAGRRELIAHLEETLGVYRGEFMEGFSLEDAPEFELWLEAERERWRGVFGELCHRLSSLQVEAGETRKAIDTVRLWTRHAPLDEIPYRRLVELLSVAGDGTGALLAYEDFRNTLKRRLGLEPSPQMRELAERLREEVEERGSLDAGRGRSATTSSLLALEVPFAGRHNEFGTLVSEYHAACAGDRAGKTCVVAVLGEAGIGKTRLANEFLGWARARGADVLRGGASEGTRLPYRPVVEAISPRIERERAPDDLLEDAWLSELSRLLPELKARYPDLPSPTSGEAETAKAALFEAIARTVEALASRAPVVLFLDDLQWVDATTLEVLDYAGSRWAEQGASVLVLVAARPEEPEGRAGFERWLSSLGRRLPVRNLTLGPLGNEDVGGLLRRLARAESTSPAWAPEQPGGSNGAQYEQEHFVERLLAETGGQPFYLVETLKALLEAGKLVIRAKADGETVVEVGPAWREGSTSRGLLPQSVREVIHARLSRLSATASELLRAGAVLERGFGFESVVRVAGLGEAEGLRGLDELIERRLLLEEAGGREEEEQLLYPDTTYSFSHEKIRQVAYTEGGRARRRVLHRRAFEVLEKERAPAAQLARHALAGGLAEQAFGYSVAAGDEAMEMFAVRDALEHYQRARTLLAQEVRTGGARQLVEPSIPDLKHLYTQLGRAYELTDEWGKAQAAYETMLALGRRLGEARLEVVALNHLAVLRFPYQKVDLPKAKALLEEARRVAEEAGLTEALVETECNLADLMSFWAKEPEHSRPPAEKALASARALVGRPDLIARTLWTLARVEMDAGRLEESAAYAEESAALSRKLAERPAPRTLLPSMLAAGRGLVASWRAGTKAMEIRCLGVLAFDRIWQGRLQEGTRIAREAHGISRELPAQAEAMGSWALGPGLVETGEYEEGLELCRRGTELARKLPNVFLLWYNLDNLGRAYEALLDLEKAHRVYEEALDLSGPLGPRYEKFSSIKLSAVAALSENWEEAYAYVLRAREVGTFFIRLDSFYLYRGVEALLRGGDERSAREELLRFAERAEVNERNRISYLRSLAVLSEFEGDQESTIDHLHEAHTLAQKIGLPGELWQIRSRIGELYERRGESEQAREAFSIAAQTLRMLAQKIGDEGLRERFLSAPQARRVLGRR
jgi:DNA-binding SARP family transcriptional activator/tetratricopeptide (TPR) repeat protein